MLFSICIPVYNTSQYLDECLRSVLCQTETDYEIVLVDDGSTDGSGTICDRYASEYPNIRVIHKENEGLLMTRRRGFQEARGAYFICLDSDDALNSDDALKKIRQTIEETKADLVIYDYLFAEDISSPKQDKFISLFDHPSGYIFQKETKKELYDKLLLGKYLNPIVIKAVSRNLLDFDTDYSQWKTELVNSQGEDLFQSLPILDAAERVAYLKEPLYFYRWNPDSISRNIRPDYYYAYRTVYQRTDAYLDKWGFDDMQRHRIDQHRINMIFGILLTQGRAERNQWLNVLRDASDDPFFLKLWQKRDAGYISRYYLLMGDLLVKKQFGILQIVKMVTGRIVSVKQKIRNRRK